MKRKAIIISLSTTYLTSYEKRIIKKEKPWGIILFKRNIISSEQIINLIKSIKMIANDKKFPILVDEEGGRVTRLTNLIMNQFSQKYFGDLFDINKQIGLATYKSYIKSGKSQFQTKTL